MSMQEFCQWAVLAHLILIFFTCVHLDFNGRKAKEPDGFSGFVGTLIIVGLFALAYYGSGAFDLIAFWKKQ
jgi:membrane protease YdiL (CAAX protease family)